MTFVPNRIELHPQPRIDDCSEGLLRACYRRFAWLAPSLPRLLALGLPTGGTLVAWLVARRLRRLVSLEQQKLDLLAAWIDRPAPGTTPDASTATGVGAPASRVPGIRALSLGTTVATVAATVSLVLFVATLRRGSGGAFAAPAALLGAPLPGQGLRDGLGLAFHAVAVLPFLTLAVAVIARRAALRGFVAWFNARAAAEELPPVHLPAHWLRWARWHWAIGALAVVGPAWATAMTLAGLLFLGYVRGTSDVLFVQFGETFRAGVERSHPGAFVPERPDVLQRCADPACPTLRPDGVRHCPRCGQGVRT